MNVLTVLFFVSLFGRNDALCIWPGVFMNTDWWDSRTGSLHFTATQVSGLHISLPGTNISAWQCVNKDSFNSNGILILKNQDSFNYLSAQWTVYMCLELRQITPQSYRYYQLHAMELNAGRNRVHVSIDSNLSDVSTICDPSNGARDPEFAVIVKQGFEANVKTTCPAPLIGTFELFYTMADGNDVCSEQQMTISTCTDSASPIFNSTCLSPPHLLGSDSVCAYDVTIGTDTYVQLFYPTSASGTIKSLVLFACLAVSSDSTTATIVSGNCTDHQNSTYAARSHDNRVIGDSIRLQAINTCPTVTAVSNLCSGNCVVGSDCQIDTGNCSGGCAAGWQGDTCSTECDDGYYGEGCQGLCSGHCRDTETCRKDTGACPVGCEPGWSGDTCHTPCAEGRFGYDCNQVCSSTCGSCDQVTGTCSTCKKDWAGPNCNINTADKALPVVLIVGVTVCLVVVLVLAGIIVTVVRRSHVKTNSNDENSPPTKEQLQVEYKTIPEGSQEKLPREETATIKNTTHEKDE